MGPNQAILGFQVQQSSCGIIRFSVRNKITLYTCTAASTETLELPSQIVYHAVVGAKSTRFGEAAHVVYSQSLSALRAIGNETELLVDEVELLTTELHRITVLPEERWLHKLGHMASDVARRFERVNKETARIMANATMVMGDKNRIVRDTYTTLLKPVLGTVDKLIAETLDCGAKSVYDTWFANEAANSLIVYL
ncbi:hypothetical protein SeLEV6574_g00490 [Synchytrium endobioticum]|uniref:Uncharacterized protein n=1 Tax=Synchytrium endobioticum TaxID=286115 RepID=A0A507DJN3_9FUNG|nr:hypothetical protein SeLEV6574_g00490 [Synchytrium endobioticum]